MNVAVLGLGEAGSFFANDMCAMGFIVSGWDPSPQRKLHKNVRFAVSNADAAKDADIIFSVNLSSVSEAIAKEVLPVLNASKIYAEMNTSSPQKKMMVYEILKPSAVQYVDLAIMAPVPPKGIKTPFLLSGPGAILMKEKLKSYDLDMEVLSETTGDASTKKLLRSIVYKGIAAVICEAMEAGKAFGEEDYIREQISAIIGGNNELIDRFTEGSRIHAKRRIHEMEAVADMLAKKNIKAIMAKAAKENLEKLLNEEN
jgi:3-hydroxyisobutyrate dehydrogenase-like beta-hydroxyacid dehydrogenase